ncbi:PucR family transcriptional regulator [Nocardia bovistercoris]|uniref:Helix-turn-helix domain-containing protein n=1 Tax=Nocardia bovistercoris TaxID=2785916 RepID=A0A931I8E2_9NOCA|nr:helix-turn-helix domain-containing protein [Nocardia bovistercoris]MBH0776559.1 helix-turn-helix domain-containing protein [Nocardia bovistercoris]
MTTGGSASSDLIVSGQPVSSSLKDVRAVSRKMVGHFLENVVPCRTLPGEALDGDVTAITRTCLEIAVSMLEGADIPEKTQQLRNGAEGWAREGIPIDTIHHAVHEGFKLGFDLILADAGPDDFESIKVVGRRLLEILDIITSTVSYAYVRELRTVAGEHHTAAHTLTSALLGGHATSTMARECGIEIAQAYCVLAVAVPPHPEERDARLDGKVVARRKLRRIQAELVKRCGDSVLTLLSVDGGTILLPSGLLSSEALDHLIEQLSRAGQVPIAATMVDTPTAQIPDAADQAHELLDMVQRLNCVRGLYRFDDLALEYQLTRPGPGLERLRTILGPLDEHPELFETLQRHISNNLNRQRTARALHVHTNTVDYRLKRIGQLTGFDPSEASGLWYLRAAIIARSYQQPAQRASAPSVAPPVRP